MAKDLLMIENDLLIKDGDYVVGESTQQHIEHILLARPGEYKNVPWIGVALEDYIQGPQTPIIEEEIKRKIRLHIESDGAKVGIIELNQFNEAKITATYD
jgi:phage baseplate assembly protein W